MKNKIIVLASLIVLATVSSVSILYTDGYFDRNKVENKILSVEQPMQKPIILAKETTPKKNIVAVKKTTINKKTPVKKINPKKKKTVKKKSKLNLNPTPFTVDTAPFSAKNKYN